MRKPINLIILLIIAFAGCKRSNSLMQQLTEIDSIANQKGDSTTFAMLEEIAPESINKEECIAYYWLLRIRTEIRLQKQILNSDPINYSINYYSKHNHKGKLARAYSYKAYILDNLGRTNEAILCLKEAEEIVKDNPNEVLLANIIYTHLGRINHKVKESQLSIEYSQKALRKAYETKSNYYIAYSLMNIYIDYKEMGNKDSASYYLNILFL